MQDVFGVVTGSRLTQVFDTPCQWGSVWEKPRGARVVFITAIGAGGGGGGGFSAAATNPRGGGGGGAQGACITCMIPAMYLPNRLFVQVTAGGLGGAAGLAGASSTATVVTSIAGVTSGGVTVINVAGVAPGQPGTAAAGGNGGSGTTPSHSQCLSQLGLTGFYTSQGGSAGGAQTGAAAANVSGWNNAFGLTTAGTGGGGCQSADFAGGNITSVDTTRIPTASGGAAGSNNGLDGAVYRNVVECAPFLARGGTGGGASNAGVGGNGGNGAIGCGGGGGGGGTTGGSGGNGGCGMVVFTVIL